MRKLAGFLEPKTNFGPADGEGPNDARLTIKRLFFALPRAEQQAVLAELTADPSEIPAPRAGPVLAAIANSLPSKIRWTVAEIKDAVAKAGVIASQKEVYDAIGYLNRRRFIRQIGYGRYFVNPPEYRATGEDHE